MANVNTLSTGLAAHVEHELQIWEEFDESRLESPRAYVLWCDTCDEQVLVEKADR